MRIGEEARSEGQGSGEQVLAWRPLVAVGVPTWSLSSRSSPSPDPGWEESSTHVPGE